MSQPEATVPVLFASSGTLLRNDNDDDDHDTVVNASSNNILKEAPLPDTNQVSAKPHIPSISASAVLGESSCMPVGSIECHGFDFNSCLDNSASYTAGLDALLSSFSTMGFQATHLGQAIQQIQRMRQWRLSDIPWQEGDDVALKPMPVRNRVRARIFLGYTSNQISCGQREIIRFLVQHHMVDVLVTTAGGIEEDIIKCMQPTYLGDFKYNGRELRKQGINRIGNLLVSTLVQCFRTI